MAFLQRAASAWSGRCGAADATSCAHTVTTCFKPGVTGPTSAALLLAHAAVLLSVRPFLLLSLPVSLSLLLTLSLALACCAGLGALCGVCETCSCRVALTKGSFFYCCKVSWLAHTGAWSLPVLCAVQHCHLLQCCTHASALDAQCYSGCECGTARLSPALVFGSVITAGAGRGRSSTAGADCPNCL